MSDKSFWSDLSLDTCLLRSWSFITFEVGGGHFEKALVRRIQNNPPIQPSFLEMIPQKFYVIVIWNPQILQLQIAPKFTTYFIQSHVYEIGVYYLRLLHSISIHAPTVLGYFQEIYENHPSGNTPLFENVPLRSFKILK